MSRAVAAAIAIALTIVLAIAWAGRASEGRRALVESDAALGRGDAVDAILAARVAAEARCPTCAAPEEALAKLEQIAKDAEARGDDATAFAAWRAVRAALLATSGFATTSDRRAHAEVEVARFAHRLEAAAVAGGAPPTAAAAEDKLRAGLAASDAPSGTVFALVGIGGLVFLIGAARFARADKAGRGRTDLGLALAGAALAVAGALLF
ncbi:MAG TPA: hypothetical protein VLT33_40495 [Labilithrix sp.]|nr:hypothetical protein [Labilithrix sp.]